MRKLRKTLALRENNERGVTLIEVVMAMALFLIIGGTFVYSLTVVNKVGTTSVDKSKDAMEKSATLNILRNDLSRTKNIKSNASQIFLAKNDGTCVNWLILFDGNGTYNLVRSSATNAPASTTTGSIIQHKMKVGSFFGSDTDGVSVKLTMTSGVVMEDRIPLTIAGASQGVCWTT